MDDKKKIVLKVTEDINPEEIYCTTYQMRNFYRQMGDGFFSALDVMNYIQHHRAVLMMRPGYRVLDVCCGRGLLLPLIRWHRKDIQEYVGVDISKKNIEEQLRWSGLHRINGLDYYPFKVTHKIGSVEDMNQWWPADSFDFIVYTSSIEHMQKEVGIKSLKNCYELLKSRHQLFISTPNTRSKEDDYDTRYAAHLYEWNARELHTELKEIGFTINGVIGLTAKKRVFDRFIKTQSPSEQRWYSDISQYFPTEWLMPFVACRYPTIASEVLLIARK